MGATYLSMQIRTTDRDTVVAALEAIAAHSRQIFYIQPDGKLMAVNFDPRTGSAGAPHTLFQTRIVALTSPVSSMMSHRMAAS